jgi:hypothetical protein
MLTVVSVLSISSKTRAIRGGRQIDGVQTIHHGTIEQCGRIEGSVQGLDAGHGGHAIEVGVGGEVDRHRVFAVATVDHVAVAELVTHVQLVVAFAQVDERGRGRGGRVKDQVTQEGAGTDGGELRVKRRGDREIARGNATNDVQRLAAREIGHELQRRGRHQRVGHVQLDGLGNFARSFAGGGVVLNGQATGELRDHHLDERCIIGVDRALIDRVQRLRIVGQHDVSRAVMDFDVDAVRAVFLNVVHRQDARTTCC